MIFSVKNTGISVDKMNTNMEYPMNKNMTYPVANIKNMDLSLALKTKSGAIIMFLRPAPKSPNDLETEYFSSFEEPTNIKCMSIEELRKLIDGMDCEQLYDEWLQSFKQHLVFDLPSQRVLETAVNYKLQKTEKMAKEHYPLVMDELKKVVEKFETVDTYNVKSHEWNNNESNEDDEVDMLIQCYYPTIKKQKKKIDELDVPVMPIIKQIDVPVMPIGMIVPIIMKTKKEKKEKKENKNKKSENTPVLLELSNEEKEILKKSLMKEEEVVEEIKTEEDAEEKEEEIIIDYNTPKQMTEEEEKYAEQRRIEIEKEMKKKNEMNREKKQRQKIAQEQKEKEDKKGKRWNWVFNTYDREYKKNIKKEVEVSEPENEERKEAFDLLKDVDNLKTSLVKSTFCRSVTNKGFTCKYGKDCKFAHTVEELVPSLCVFKSSCKYIHDKTRPCPHLHPKEDKQSFLKRLNINAPVSDMSTRVLPAPSSTKTISTVDAWKESKSSISSYTWNRLQNQKVNMKEIIQEESSKPCEHHHHHSHDVQVVESQEEIRTEAFSILSNTEEMKKIINNNKKSKLCNILLEKGSCFRAVCNFAHSLEEFNPVKCVFSSSCKFIDTCPYIHPNETIEQCASRQGLKIVKKVEQPKIEKKTEVKVSTVTWNVKTPVEKVIEKVEEKVEEKKIEKVEEKKIEKEIEENFEFVSYKKDKKQPIQTTQPIQPPLQPIHTSPIVCRNISMYGFCKYADTCLFAHNVHELLPRDCSHGSRCRYSNNCHFLHPHETVQMYVQRRNIPF